MQQAYYVTGSADFIIIVSAPSVEVYDHFMSRLVVENANVRRFTTNVAMSVLKRGLFIPVSELGAGGLICGA